MIRHNVSQVEKNSTYLMAKNSIYLNKSLLSDNIGRNQDWHYKNRLFPFAFSYNTP
jgi:hypothetical protein